MIATPRVGFGRGAGVALVSAAVLLLQIVQTRLFSVMLWHHLTYLVVTFTLLGFAAGGAVLACRPAWLAGAVSRRLATCSLLFGALTIGAYALITRVLPHAEHTSLGIARAAVDYAVLLVPMVFAGFAIALSLTDAKGAVGRLYGVNMVGSALGCVIYVPALRVLGGEGSVLLACSLAMFAGTLFAGAGHRATAVLCGLCGAVTLAFAVIAPTAVFSTPVATSKAMAQHMAQNPDLVLEEQRWDPLCRIDVVGPGPKRDAQGVLHEDTTSQRTIYQDGDAPTVLPMGAAQDSVNIFDKEGLAYLMFLDRAPKVLAIGIGGGIDILQSQATHRPVPAGQHVDFTGVEINTTTTALMRGEFKAKSGDRYELPHVKVVLDEGRSWLRRSPEKYDIIQMTGTDTYAALSSGSYVMSESYLYTAEAYDDFLGHLTDDGVISVLRFRFEPPRETLRLAGIAVDALRRAGAEHPENHFVMLGFDGPRVEIEGRTVGLDYGALLIRRQPFRPEQVAVYQKYCAGRNDMSMLYAPGVECRGKTAEFFAAVADGTDAAFRERYVYNLDAVTDDSPFFFRYDKWGDALRRIFHIEGRSTATLGEEYSGIVGAEPLGLIMLGTVLGESSLLVALLLLVPLWIFRREGLKVQGAPSWILYFFGLGAGYILVEIVAMQRFVLFLGNPGYAVTVVLITFLLFSGLGATFAGRSADPRRTLTRALLAVLVLIGLLAVALPPVFHAALALPLPARIALTVALLAPAAFVMGMPFPSGLALLGRRGGQLVPWAFGVNGGASVIASVIGILVAMSAGFSMAFLLAALAYGSALLAGRRAPA
ncbi:MAG TPA: hypothetical protein VK824_00800 [Planctomycetota bacterium]|nr:hypothetical protein [Planctomycetota bacterium]